MPDNREDKILIVVGTPIEGNHSSPKKLRIQRGKAPSPIETIVVAKTSNPLQDVKMSDSPAPQEPRQLVLTLLGPDRPGIVARVASLIAERGGNWMESRMVRLGGQFAGLVQAQVPVHESEALLAAIEELQGENLRLTVEDSQQGTALADRVELRLELVTPDRPGILREVTAILASQGFNVEELATEFVAAPWSGEPLFKAVIKVSTNRGQDTEALREALEETSAGMMLDLSMSVS